MVLARQIETDDKIDEPTHILQQVISNNHQQSPASNKSSSKEEIKDPLEIRTSKLTTEEERKKKRVEKKPESRVNKDKLKRKQSFEHMRSCAQTTENCTLKEQTSSRNN